MKRLVVLIGILSMVFGIVAFDCSSSEMNAAKMYMTDKVKNYAKAREQLDILVAKEPNNDEALFYLGKIDGIEGKYKDMNKNFNKSLAVSQKFKADIEMERNLHLRTVIDKGNAFYNRAGKQQGDMAKDSYEKALVEFDNAIAIAPDSAFTYESYIYSALYLNKYDLIKEPLKVLIPKAKSAVPFKNIGLFLLNIGVKAKDAGNKDEAMKLYNEAVDILNQGKARFSTDSGLMDVLANAYIMANRVDEAKASFTEGVRTQPNNKTYRYNLGTILLNLKEFPAAEEHLKKAVELDPEYLDAVYNLASCYINWAVDLNEKAQAAGQVSPEFKEKIKMALPLLNKYLEKKPTDANVWEALARVHTGLGNVKEAEEAFKKADENKK